MLTGDLFTAANLFLNFVKTFTTQLVNNLYPIDYAYLFRKIVEYVYIIM